MSIPIDQRRTGKTQSTQSTATQPETQASWFDFGHAARIVADALGTSWAFLSACIFVLVWAASGPLFRFSDAWQLVINTGTTIATFLIVFLIQNTQNRDAKALHLKLDEIIRSSKARNKLIDLEDCTDEELNVLQQEFAKLRTPAAATRERASGKDTHRTRGMSKTTDD